MEPIGINSDGQKVWDAKEERGGQKMSENLVLDAALRVIDWDIQIRGTSVNINTSNVKNLIEWHQAEVRIAVEKVLSEIENRSGEQEEDIGTVFSEIRQRIGGE